MSVNRCVNMCYNECKHVCKQKCKLVCEHKCKQVCKHLKNECNHECYREIANWYRRTDMSSFLSCFATKNICEYLINFKRKGLECIGHAGSLDTHIDIFNVCHMPSVIAYDIFWYYGNIFQMPIMKYDICWS
jgi:hypothetical protein